MIVVRYSWNEYQQMPFPPSEYLFNQADFLGTIAQAYQKEISVYTVTEKEKALLSVPILHHKRNASLATHFFYQAIIKHQDFSEHKLLEIWELLLNRLKIDFDSIDFKLAPYAEDIRALTWAGFGNKIYYTATVDLVKEPNYSENIRRSIKKALKAGLSISTHSYHEEIIREQVSDMRKNGLSSKEPDSISQWMKTLSESRALIIFELLDADQQRIGSSIYLMDKKQAYLISVMGGKEESGGQAYLYDQAFAYFKAKGIGQIDLLGANLPSIAIYKSKLGAKQQSYVISSYRKFFFFTFLSHQTKTLLKRLLKSIRIINK
jgi:hypothetical protein